MKKSIVSIFLIVFAFSVFAKDPAKLRVEPPFWWAGMKNTALQLMVHGDNITGATVDCNYEGVEIKTVVSSDNENYLFLNIELCPEVKPGSFDLVFSKNKKEIAKYHYELKAREKNSAMRNGFNNSDVIYLITPDRFANGNPDNDALPEMKEKPNRADKDGRHGGDLRGIINSLDYLKDLGFTAVWLNPVLENNMTRTSYHGYSTTDFYKVDPRYGSNEEYQELNTELDKRGMKLIMDMIFNHCGSEHWWMEDMPMKDWINNPQFKQTNHRRTVNQDPHASDLDKKEMLDGWFVPTMPDLNQNNPYMETYLIQNSIWWTEYVGLEGIRQDTWPYPDKHMMTRWTARMLEEYPNFNIVGEEWATNAAIVSYWQKGKNNSDGYQCHLPSLMDFPLQNAVSKGLTEKEDWGTGLITIYEALANDFQYPDANNLVIFPDNHDMSRFYMQVGQNVDLLKMGVAFFLTTRGIPQIYYGTEVLLTHPGDQHGDIRADYPGGWKGDAINAFTGKGLSEEQKDMLSYVKNVQNWRKDKEVIHSGKLKHFIPQDGMYVYFRYNETASVMVILNKNKETKTLETSRFAESLKGLKTGHDIVSGQELNDLTKIQVPALSAMIIELK